MNFNLGSLKKKLLGAIRRIYRNNYLLILSKDCHNSGGFGVDCINSLAEYEKLITTCLVTDIYHVNITCELTKGSRALVYCLDQEVVGYLFFTSDSIYTKEIKGYLTPCADEVYIYNIFVNPKYRGRKIQYMLMNSVTFYTPNINKAYISVRSNNYYSLRNITNNGFQFDGFVQVIFILGMKFVVDYKKGNLDVRI